jgi:alginate O-acetyltransferase complex protein AlgI
VLFNSLSYAWFLPLVFGLYWWLAKVGDGIKWQNRFVLAASLLFYGWWDWRFLSLLIVSSLTDYFVGLKMSQSANERERKWLISISLGVNLGMLAVFKYFNFFLHSLERGLSSLGLDSEMPALEILLPVGISFYTFQTLSYAIDIYRRELPATRNPVNFMAFVSFFPQLVAGPIERAAKLLPQFERKRKFDYAQSVRGLRLILWGIVKKVVIADTLAPFVEQVFAPGSHPTGLDVVLGTLFFAIQIYCDFSGYSDVAIGTARLFGFELMVNFRLPYFAKTLREFWARWHISLTTWFRDYLYLPLGGNRVNGLRLALNLMVVFVVSGIWHGAALSFVAWGAIHGVFYVLERFGKLPERVPVPIYRVFTLVVVLLAWIFFRAHGAQEALRLLGELGNWQGGISLFHGFSGPLNEFLSDGVEPLFVALILAVFIWMESLTSTGDINELCDRMPRWTRWAFYYGLVVALLLFGAYGIPQQFIYFQF